MLAGDPIPVFGDGTTRRDYTFISDIVAGIRGAIAYDRSRYEVINLGNDRTVTLTEMIGELERALGVTARIDRQPEQPGDVPQTWASVDKAAALLGYEPKTPFPSGIDQFCAWLRQ
jgi:UDP-glucuronate 4-epimerase